MTKSGRLVRGSQLPHKEVLYVADVAKELMKGLKALRGIGKCVTIYGSARFNEDSEHYQLARDTAFAISKMGFTIMTGGGPGIMEAANRGAREAGGKSVACNIKLPFEQHENPYLDKFVIIKYFYIRKLLLRRYSEAIVVMPGGFGTMDEMFEVLTLLQTNMMDKLPVVIMGKKFYAGLWELIDNMLAEGAISPEDRDLFLITDDIEEAARHVEKYS